MTLVEGKNRFKDMDSGQGIVCGGGWDRDETETVEQLVEVKIYGWKFFLWVNLLILTISGLLIYYLWEVDVPYIWFFTAAISVVYLCLQLYFIDQIIKRFGKKTRRVKEVQERPVHDGKNLY